MRLRRSKSELLRDINRIRKSLQLIEDSEKQEIITENIGIVEWAKRYLRWTPLPYQIPILTDSSKRMAIRMSRQSGKALDISTPIATPSGWSTMGSLKVGDRVFDVNGQICNVTFTTEVMAGHKYYDVQFNDRSIIKADAEHLWLTETKNHRKRKNRIRRRPITLEPPVTTEKIKSALRVLGETNHSIQTCKPIICSNHRLPLDPYVLGLWLGDGSSYRAFLYIDDKDAPEIIDEVKKAGYPARKTKAPYEWTISDGVNGGRYNPKPSSLHSQLRHLQLYGRKRIPSIYLRTSVKDRLSLLQGLMDTDGHVDVRGNCEFSTCNLSLANGFMELISSLGIIGYLSTKQPKIKGKPDAKCALVYPIRFRTKLPAFRLRRKLGRLQQSWKPTYGRCANKRMIINIKPCESVLVRCIQVDSPTHTYLVGKTFIPSHNTETISIRSIFFAATHPNTTTLIVAPSLRQSQIMMDRIHGHLFRMKLEERRKLIFKLQRTVVRFRNGSMIVALPNSPNLLRGYAANQIICDEANFFADDQRVFYNTLFPMLATTNGALIVSSTPWGKDSVFFQMCNDPGIHHYHIPWQTVVKSGLIKKEFIDEMCKRLSPERFRREFEAEFVEEARTYFPTKIITDCIDADLDYWPFDVATNGEFFVGVDLGKRVDFTVVAVVERQEGVFYLRHLHQFPLETPYASVIGYLKILCQNYHGVRRVTVDQTGVGEYPIEEMRSSNVPNVEGVMFTLLSKEEMFGHMKQRMLQGQLKFPYDSELIGQINIEEYETLKSGHIRFYHSENSHDDQLTALALALFGSRAKIDTSPPILKVIDW